MMFKKIEFWLDMNNNFKIRRWSSLRAMSESAHATLVAYIVFLGLMLNSLYGAFNLALVGRFFSVAFALVGSVYFNFIVALWYVDMIRNSKYSLKHMGLSSAWKWIEMYLLAIVILFVAVKFPRTMVYLNILAFFELIILEPYIAYVNRKQDKKNAELNWIDGKVDGVMPTIDRSYTPPKKPSTAPAPDPMLKQETNQKKAVEAPNKPAKRDIERILDDFNSEVGYFLNDKYDEAVDGRASGYHDASSYEISEQHNNYESVYAPNGMAPEFELNYDANKNEIDVFSTANGAGLETYPLKKGVSLDIESDAHWFIADDTAWIILSELDNVI